ncbi:hypothetical protein OXYTRIMIC_499 [Oxytricha trifallax]|uniref:Uncharacterized protein n=1 Tax=Oxytricha trifallax TaxID=1172189 RepID=A0A073IBP6_9SPIT|nr:hypothetical protein OXYTRIMIC_499 [Oxytricha trifallax]
MSHNRHQFILQVQNEGSSDFWKQCQRVMTKQIAGFSHLEVYTDHSNQMYYLCTRFKTDSTGANKSYFTEKRRRGAGIMAELELKVKLLGHQSFDQFAAAVDGVKLIYGSPQNNEQFIAKQNAKKQKKLQKQECGAKGVVDVTNDYMIERLSGSAQSKDDYIKMKAHDIPQLVAIAKSYSQINYADQLIQKSGVTIKEKAPIIASLQDFLAELKMNGDNSSTPKYADLKAMGYIQILDALYELLIKRKNTHQYLEDKDHSHLEEIFVCEQYVQFNSHFHIPMKQGKSGEPQILNANEINLTKAFGSSGIAGMKRLMEGEGMVIEQKYGGVECKYIVCFTVITSNALPFNSMDPEDANAFKARCLLCQSIISTQSGEEAFPSTAPLGARFLNARFLADEKEKNAVD